jgi:hypothetical protein
MTIKEKKYYLGKRKNGMLVKTKVMDVHVVGNK